MAAECEFSAVVRSAGFRISAILIEDEGPSTLLYLHCGQTSRYLLPEAEQSLSSAQELARHQALICMNAGRTSKNSRNDPLNVNNTISGAGSIGAFGDLTLNNETLGIINATGANNPLILDGRVNNAGLIEATGIAGLTSACPTYAWNRKPYRMVSRIAL